MDSVRQAHRIRSVNISSETMAAEQKLTNVQLAKSKLEASIKARTDEAQAIADGALKKALTELEVIERLKESSKNDVIKINQFKDQAKQSQTNELLARKDFQNLQKQNKDKVLYLLLTSLKALILSSLLLDERSRKSNGTINGIKLERNITGVRYS